MYNEEKKPIIHNRLRVVLALSTYLLLQHFSMSTTFNMSDNKSIISLSAIPKLRNNANSAAWKQAVENQLLLAGCIGIVDGSDMEPFRTIAATAARSARAGSAPPTAEERIPETDLTVEQLEEWRNGRSEKRKSR